MSVYNRKSWIHNGTKHWIHNGRHYRKRLGFFGTKKKYKKNKNNLILYNGKHYNKELLNKWKKEDLPEYLWWSEEETEKDYKQSYYNWIKYGKQ